MKTPFCVAAGIRQRELDELRRAITAELARLDHTVERIAAIDAATTAERPIAAREWTSAADHYFGRLRQERDLRLMEQSRASAGLADLRERAASALASLRAIEEAAASWRNDARRRIDAADQSASDDRAAAVHVRRVAADRKRAA